MKSPTLMLLILREKKENFTQKDLVFSYHVEFFLKSKPKKLLLQPFYVSILENL